MVDNTRKARVYQLDFDESSVQERLCAGHPTSDAPIFQNCIPLEGKERQEAIEDLVSLCPEGFLEKDGPDSIKFCREAGEMSDLWVRMIKEVAAEVDQENVIFAKGPTADLTNIIRNPLDTRFMFCIQDIAFCWTAYPSCEFMRALCLLEKGDRLYVGSVLECR